MSGSADRMFVFITGATGFLGQQILADLLARDVCCIALVRQAPKDAAATIAPTLASRNLDPGRLISDGRLVLLHGDLPRLEWLTLPVPVGAVVHAAAVTRFNADGRGEPDRTNIAGTRSVLAFCDRQGIDELHFVSTAYVCGRMPSPITERLTSSPPAFHNDYERSKWIAEHLCADWANRSPRSLTIYRPSVIVGEHATGRATKFDGFYLMARATELLARSVEGTGNGARYRIPLRIVARPDDRQNIVPVDYVARMIGGIVTSPALHGRVYHLTHPEPPSNAGIKQALERYFDIAGGRFVMPGDALEPELNERERLFRDMGRPVEHYMIDTPHFLRHNAAVAEARLGLACPRYDEAALLRLIQFAHACQWGRRRSAAPVVRDVPPWSAYFEQFLPRHIGRSRVVRAIAMDVTIRFIIDPGRGRSTDYVCRFVRGHLVSVQRDASLIREDFGYRATPQAFWQAISGQGRPEDLFLSGQAEVFGDVERALKMGMILSAFNREFPCDRESLRRYGGAA